jgi:vanillate/3-O-methylgallate O-demethylase
MLGGRMVRALKHTMAGRPGSDAHGLELFGPVEDGGRVLDAILAAGEEFGLLRGGALAYYSSAIESGYLSQPVPAIYSGERMRGYREWLPANGYEASLSIGGSFASDDIEDYYRNPWDMDYRHIMKFDHDFIGREALEAIADQPHTRKVWLRWNDDDVMRVIRSSLFDSPETRAKFLDYPLGRYARAQFDNVLACDRHAGVSTLCGYTANVGGFLSVAMLDPQDAVDGKDVTIGCKHDGPRQHPPRPAECPPDGADRALGPEPRASRHQLRDPAVQGHRGKGNCARPGGCAADDHHNRG